MGHDCLKSWPSTQTVIALSSGEAEFYSITKGAAQGMGLQSLLQDMGISVEIRLMTDASTGKAIASRRGLGKVRHIATHELWIQDEVLKGRLTIIKLKNILNTSDVLTKYLDKRALDEAIAQLDHHFEEGRSPVAPLLGKICEPGSTHRQTSARPVVDEFQQTMARPIVHTSAVQDVDEIRQTLAKPNVDDKGLDEAKLAFIAKIFMRQVKTNQAPKESERALKSIIEVAEALHGED